MLITKDFIVINNPKTGSSFVRFCLKSIYKRRYKEYNWFKKAITTLKISQPELIELMMRTDKNIPINQHGTVNQIPKRYLHNRKVISVVRNPYTMFLSQYNFGWWVNNHIFSSEFLKKNLSSNFPNLSIDEFVDFKILNINKRHPCIKSKQIGQQTIRFIKMFFNDPVAVIANISHDYILSGAYKKDLKPITFLKQENLRDDLISFLEQYDFTQEELDIVKNHQRVNVTQDKDPTKPTVHTQKSLDYIKTYERLLFKIYEDLGIVYNEP